MSATSSRTRGHSAARICGLAAVIVAASLGVFSLAADRSASAQPTGTAAATTTATATTLSSPAPTVSTTPATLAPTTLAPTTVAPTTIAPTTIPPATIAPTTIAPAPPAPTNQSTCGGDLASASMTVSMPSIGYTCPVYAGGQSTLNTGVATLFTDHPASELFTNHPGQPGTLWIAGHRTSHGAAFAAVPDLPIGSLVTVTEGNTSATYVVVDRVRVQVSGGQALDASGTPSGSATLDALVRPDRGGNLAPRLLLQTCDGQSFRWMIYADLVG